MIGKTKNITLIGVNFYPEDSAIGLYSTQMAEFLSEKGHEVSIITGFPYYPQWEIKDTYRKKARFYTDTLGDIKIYRYKQYVPIKPSFFKRILHILDFTFFSLFNLRKIKDTNVIISVVPFTSSILLGWILKKKTGAKLWAHVQDFEFDAALQTGVSHNKKGIKAKIFKMLFGIEKKLFSKVDIASSISNIMCNKLTEKTNAEIFFLPNWIDADKINPEKGNEHPYLRARKFKILYSGNIGNKQDWEIFMLFVKIIEEFKAEIVVVGDGAKKDWLLNEIKTFEYVKYYNSVPFDDLSSLLCSADMHILFQKQNVLDTVMPSKLLGMMASQKPSFVVGNPDSEVKKILNESKGGYYFSDFDEHKVKILLNEMMDNKEKRELMGEAARNYVMNKFSKEMILSSLEIKINSL